MFSLIGQTISHYRVLERLGEGGMGTVYKAQDTRLDRLVALKFLLQQLTRDPNAVQRFIQEAKAASALQHPNICVVHDIDQLNDGQMFISMEYLEGETLKKKIENEELRIEDGIDIAHQIAEGLAKAHERGVVHRDIKPANIIVTQDGIAKIVDFGIAKLVGTPMLTRTGTTLGTAAYMSPEQAQGENVDHRTDIWSLGVVLYEMLAGRLPFRGEHEAAQLYSIVHEQPQSLLRHGCAIPPQVSTVINRALEKIPANRYQTARGFAADLRRANEQSVPVPPEWETSIVVLPFENLSPDPDQEYFSDGLTEEVISDLSHVRSLRVISRSSAMTFKGTRKTVPEIAAQLNVNYVLEGSVRKAGNNLRITAQLIDSATDMHLWSEKFNREVSDVFEIQDEISSAIVNALKVTLTPQEHQKLSEHPIDNIKAYDCYLKAWYQIYQFNEESLDGAFSYLRAALDIMGDNAELYAGMAAAYGMRANIGLGKDDAIALAEEYARKALALKPDHPGALMTIADLSFYNEYPENWHNIFDCIGRALLAHPSSPEVLALVPIFLSAAGQSSKAMVYIDRLDQLDPLNTMRFVARGLAYYYGGNFHEAVEQFRQYYEADPSNHLAQSLFGWGLVSVGRRDEALVVVNNVEGIQGVHSVFALLLRYAIQEDKERALGLITPAFEKTCRRCLEHSYGVASRLSLLGARHESLDWLEHSIHRGFINYPFLQCDPLLDNIRREKRFGKLMDYARREWEGFLYR